MSVHDGHRERVKSRFLTEGLEHFDDVNVLELLLFFAIPRQDTNPIAHRLLQYFGSLSGVLDASPEALMQVPGVGKSAAILLNLTTAMVRRYHISLQEDRPVFKTINQCGRYLVPRFYGFRVETVFMLCLDATHRLLSCRMMGQGSVNSAGVPTRKIVEHALSVNAAFVILAHNHPSGIAVPSRDDIGATLHLNAALSGVDIVLADHIIVAGEDYISMVESRKFTPSKVIYDQF